MRLGWYAQRLRAMSTAEVGSRAARHAAFAADAASWHVARPLWRRRWHADGLPPTPPRPAIGFLTRERAGEVRTAFPEASSRLVDAAEAAAQGRFRFFGYPGCQVDLLGDFAADPLSGRRWPSSHAKHIDYRTARYGDPKWIWELNRLQFLPQLVAASLLTGDDRLAHTAVRSAVHWCGTQPVGRGIAWANGFEAGLRGISLALAWDAQNATMPDADRSSLLTSLHQHASWIGFDPALHSSANNHRVGELAGLATIAMLAPELPGSPEWLDEAMEGLAQESGRQIQADGTGAEQAFAYHVFVCDLLLLVMAVADASGQRVPAEIGDALERSAVALWAELGPGEPAPAYGDADDGRALLLDDAPLRDPRATAAAIAARFGSPQARAVAGELDATSLWLFGPAGRERFEATTPAEGPGSVTLRDRVILRRGGTRTTLDTGPLGYLAIAAHGHADALSVTLARDGAEIVVDPGTGSYFGDAERRRYFRGTASHATVTVDGLDQSESAGPFAWRAHARAWPVLVDLDRGIAVAEHDGYGRLEDPVRHRRVVVATDDGVLVYDRLDARREHHYSQRWPFAPRLDAVPAEGALLELLADGELAYVARFAASAPAALSVVRGWWSRRLESAEPAPLAAWECRVAGRCDLVAFLGARDPGAIALDRVGGRAQIRAGDLELAIDLDDPREPVVARQAVLSR